MKIVIVTSAGLSGAGAISDYLLSRSDFTSPFKNKLDYKQDYELRMVADPFGIDHLYQNFYENFSINNAAYSLFQFTNYINNLKKIKDVLSKKPIYNKFFFDQVDLYKKKIVKLSYYGLPQHYSISMSPYQKLTWRISNYNQSKFAQETNFYKMVIPVNKKKFMSVTNKFLLKVISQHDLTKKKNIVVDQGGNFWNPISSTKYFINSKVIQVIRDPKAIFSSMKTRKSLSYPGNDINLFIKWFKEIQEKRNYHEEKKTLQIKFEDFVLKHEIIKKKINNFLKIKNEITDFDLENSKKNIFKYKKNLTTKEIKKINLKLKKFIYFND